MTDQDKHLKFDLPNLPPLGEAALAIWDGPGTETERRNKLDALLRDRLAYIKSQCPGR